MHILKLEKENSIARLTFCRPDILNAVGKEGDADNFVTLCNEINEDKNIRVVIITGEGKAFSAGGDIKAMKEKTGYFKGNSAEIADAYRKEVHRIVKSFWGIQVPVVAAINGPAVGLGFDIASMCDIRIASTNAKFGIPFLKIGLIPGDGGAWLTPRVLGMSNAARLLYTSEIIDAEKALSWNFVSEIVEADELADAAFAIASIISEQPPQALRLSKSLLRRGMTASFEEIMDLSAAYQGILHETDEHKEGINAIIEKRKPIFK
jgi:2-(1,2-epoxy-1,2-dihydrophenyl)acetyl-CoA isomerase